VPVVKIAACSERSVPACIPQIFPFHTALIRSILHLAAFNTFGGIPGQLAFLITYNSCKEKVADIAGDSPIAPLVAGGTRPVGCKRDQMGVMESSRGCKGDRGPVGAMDDSPRSEGRAFCRPTVAVWPLA
jgi:hypothetical protein